MAGAGEEELAAYAAGFSFPDVIYEELGRRDIEGRRNSTRSGDALGRKKGDLEQGKEKATKAR